MLGRLGALALPLGFLCALALGACGSDDGRESGATLTPPPISGATTAPATTASTTAATATAVTTAPTTTTTPGATQTTSSRVSGGATTTQPTTGFAGGAPAGCPNAVGGFIRDLRATDCGVARAVASAWFDAVHNGAAPDSAIQAAGYSCSGTLSGERASVTCSGGGGTVAFTASP